NLCEEVSPQSHRELITRSFVFVGAEQFDAFWVDAPDSPFTNPLTSAALHAGFVDAVKFHHEEWFEDEPFPDEALQKRGGWDEAVKFMTLDEWQKR
ncbi:hypothetical protein Q0P46_13640, partial [Staphylococcus aureus]|nr:hypothetical protein [Staphylococcus aureus]